ncbi:MAG: serine kinase [Amylibacter sp.]
MAIKNSPVHGTAIAVGGRGFLFVGSSGCGKSGLALQMMALGAELISDDQVLLQHVGMNVEMTAPDSLDSLIEARFIGVLKTKTLQSAVLCHVIDLDKEPEARMPQLQHSEVLGVRIDLINGRNVPNLASSLMILGRGLRHT